MNLLVFLFEVSDKIPTIAQMYFGGLFWAVVILITTFFNRWVGLVFLLFALLISTQSISDGLGTDIINAVIREMGSNYVKHWKYSIVFSVILEFLGFIAGISLKRFYRNRKLKLQ